MGWVGKGRISYKADGRGSVVRIGDFAVPRELTWEFEGANGDPDMSVRFEIREGRPQCVDVSVRTKPNGRGVRTSDLHALALDAMAISLYASTSMRAVYDPATNVTAMTPIGDERDFWATVSSLDAAVKAPKRGVTAAELVQVARIYHENFAHRPVQQVTAIMGYGSERTAARRVEQARAAGLLPSTSQGKQTTWAKGDPLPWNVEQGRKSPPHGSEIEQRWEDEGFSALTTEDIEQLMSDLIARGRPDLAAALRPSIGDEEGTGNGE